jgi:NAD dependent epimerase/dehydratase family enzyme
MRPGVLITGASGFTGYDFVPATLDAGMEVHAGVRANSKISQLQHFNLRYVIPDYIIMCLTGIVMIVMLWETSLSGFLAYICFHITLSRLKETPDLTPFITSKEAWRNIELVHQTQMVLITNGKHEETPN